MANQERLVELIDLTPREQRHRRRSTIGWLVVGALAGCVTVAVFAFNIHLAIQQLLTASATGQWDEYWNDTFLTTITSFLSLVPGTLAALRLLIRTEPLQELAAMQALREGAALGDDRIAPLAKDQLSAALEKPLPALPAQFAPFRRPNSTQQVQFYGILSFVCFTFGIGMAGAMLLTLYNNVDNARGFAVFYLIVAALFSLLIIPGIWAIGKMRQSQRPFTIIADEQGLHWTRPGLPAKGVLLLWNEIRSFTILQFGLIRTSKTRYTSARYVFAVDGSDITLAWEVGYTSSEAVLQSSDDMTHLIFARTSLPLRTYALDASSLLEERWRISYHKIWRTLREMPTVAFANPYLDKLKRPVPQSRPYLLVCLVLVPLLCIPALWLAGWIVQHH